ncbi:MAG: hypothetical protein J6D29_05190 [Solobacterium sp.]|nr:hypothetical protein [Solobacterium sp.]
MKFIAKREIIGLVVLIALYFMPFITVETKDDKGHTFRVPFGTTYVNQDAEGIHFRSPRSAYSLGKDAENALHSYEEKSCYGNKYFYDKENDVSYTDFIIDGMLMHSLTYRYEKGNACEGWTYDDEVAWPFGKIEEVDDSITKDIAMEKGWVVIVDGKTLNVPAYNDFSRMIKQGVYSCQRIVFYEGTKVKEVIDIQLLESGKFKITTCKNGVVETKEYARVSDNELEDGSKEVNVYESAYATEKPTLLFVVRS